MTRQLLAWTLLAFLVGPPLAMSTTPRDHYLIANGGISLHAPLAPIGPAYAVDDVATVPPLDTTLEPGFAAWSTSDAASANPVVARGSGPAVFERLMAVPPQQSGVLRL